MDVFSPQTAKLMAADALDRYEDYIINRLKDIFEAYGRPTKRDVENVVDQVIEYADGMLPNDECFGAALVNEIWDSGVIDGMAEDLSEGVAV